MTNLLVFKLPIAIFKMVANFLGLRLILATNISKLEKINWLKNNFQSRYSSN